MRVLTISAMNDSSCHGNRHSNFSECVKFGFIFLASVVIQHSCMNIQTRKYQIYKHKDIYA